MGDESAGILFLGVCSAFWTWAAWQWTRSIAFAVVGAAAAIAAYFLIAPEIGILTFVALVALIAGFIHGGSWRAGPLRRFAGLALLVVGVAAPIAETIYVASSFGAFCDRNSGTRILQRVDSVTAFADERGDGLFICHYCAAPLYRYADVLVTDRWPAFARSRINADKDGFYRLTGGKAGDAGCTAAEMPYWNSSLKGLCLIAAKIERSDAPYRIRAELHEHKTSVGMVKERREVYASADGRTIVATYGAFEREIGQMWFEGLEMAFRDAWFAVAGRGRYKRSSDFCPAQRGRPQLTIDKIFPPAR